MHEMSLAEGVLQIIEESAAKEAFQRVKTVFLEIGQLSHVEVESLRFCFDAVVRGSVAEGAVLEIDRVPGQAWCMACSTTVPVSTLYDPCPRCGGYQLTLTGGDEMRVRELEVE
ncbi:MAG: hydrogenase maturation nickel metallochaperone HypA [Gammaproteobacteria bacterium]